jgi:hypothetical protein
LFSIIFCRLEKCNSLREVAKGMVGLSGKEETVRINYLPKPTVYVYIKGHNDFKNKRKLFF